MISQQAFEGNWKEIKGQARSKWGALTDNDFEVLKGSVEQLIGMIQRKTGEARGNIEHFFDQFATEGVSAMGRAGESVRAGAQQVAQCVENTSEQAAASIREGYDEVEDLVRQRPAESLAICFGVGLVTGVVATLLLRSQGGSR